MQPELFTKHCTFSFNAFIQILIIGICKQVPIVYTYLLKDNVFIYLDLYEQNQLNNLQLSLPNPSCGQLYLCIVDLEICRLIQIKDL